MSAEEHTEPEDPFYYLRDDFDPNNEPAEKLIGHICRHSGRDLNEMLLDYYSDLIGDIFAKQYPSKTVHGIYIAPIFGPLWKETAKSYLRHVAIVIGSITTYLVISHIYGRVFSNA